MNFEVKVDLSGTWFRRGSVYYLGTDASVFAFNSAYGIVGNNNSFRLVLITIIYNV